MSLLSKREVFEQLLSIGDVLQIGVNTARAALPKYLTGNVLLHVGLELPVPIHDLEIDEYGFSATLSFERRPHRCVVPWSAVGMIGLADARQIVFWTDPDEQEDEPAVEPAKPGLRLVKS